MTYDDMMMADINVCNRHEEQTVKSFLYLNPCRQS
jgi:hypothetical protein